MKKILILICLSLITYQAYSCSCTEKPSIKTNWEEADEVFTGKIIKLDTSNYGNNGAKIFTYTVEIIKSFKKEFYKERKLRTIVGQDISSCDFMFELGKNYLIYAYKESQTLTCSICSRTDNIENVKNSELSSIEKLQKTYDPVAFVESSTNASYIVKNSFQEKLRLKDRLVYMLLIGVLFLIAVIVIVIKRKNCT